MTANRFAMPASAYKPLGTLKRPPFDLQTYRDKVRQSLRDLDDRFSDDRQAAHRDLRKAGIA